MNGKGRETKKQAKIKNSSLNFLSQQELSQRVKEIEAQMRSHTWRDLETHGKFTKNDKITFISDDTLIVGCDVGSETHYIRAIDVRGQELSKGAYPFSNTAEGFQKAKTWALEIAAEHKKKQIVLGLEPTGHYWFCLAEWMVSNGISVVQVNPYAVKQTKEVEDNSQLKDDRKDPKLIANLAKDGNYGMPYLPEGVYAEIRQLSTMRDQLTEDRTRDTNRLHKEMTAYFPEYKDAFGKLDGAFTLEILKAAPFPGDLLKLGANGLKEIWSKAGLKGSGYSRADRIIQLAGESVGLKHGVDGAREKVRWYASRVLEQSAKLKEVEAALLENCRKIPHAENLLEINGIGPAILTGIISDLGDIARFDDAKEIQKLGGLNLVACSSGKHTGETRISRRGRKRLRYWLFQAARSAVTHAQEFRLLHEYYTTRPNNPLKKMQSLIVIACKILRVVFAILKTGQSYDPQKLLSDIKRPASAEVQAA